jgi:hypothetical protein
MMPHASKPSCATCVILWVVLMQVDVLLHLTQPALVHCVVCTLFRHLNRKYMNAIVEQPLFLANKAPRARVPSSIYVPPPLQVGYARDVVPWSLSSMSCSTRASACKVDQFVADICGVHARRQMVWAGTPSSTR